MSNSQAAEADPVIAPAKPQSKRKPPKKQPRYNVVLWDDTEHTFDYVIRMLKALFAIPEERGFKMAKEVDESGRVICMTTTMELAELKRDQIRGFGRDPLSARSKGSMFATIEPAPGE